MIRTLVIAAAVACKTVPPEPEPARLEVVGEVQYACTTGVTPAQALQVDLRDREEPRLLGTAVTSSIGAFRIETEPLGFQGGRFYVELAGERVPVSGSTRLRYRLRVQLPCPQPEARLPNARALSDVTPEDRVPVP